VRQIKIDKARVKEKRRDIRHREGETERETEGETIRQTQRDRQ